MGLLESILDVPERLRVWQQAGVRYFFVESASPAETPSADAAEPRASLDPESWPAPWPGILARTPRRARILITYPELGLDLTGSSDPRRSALWRDLIRRLGLAGKGAVAFWPMAVPDAGRLVRHQDIFLAGLSLLAPGVVALFGSEAAELQRHITASPTPFPCVMLPDLTLLLDGNAEAWDHVLGILDNTRQ